MPEKRRCLFVTDQRGNHWVQSNMSMGAMWARAGWFIRLMGKRGIIASKAHWIELPKKYDTFELVENEDGSHEVRRVSGNDDR